MSSIQILALSLSVIATAMSGYSIYLIFFSHKTMTEKQLLKRAVWCEQSGEPLNKWAEELERRLGDSHD
jgi:hypothetical protein